MPARVGTEDCSLTWVVRVNESIRRRYAMARQEAQSPSVFASLRRDKRSKVADDGRGWVLSTRAPVFQYLRFEISKRIRVYGNLRLFTPIYAYLRVTGKNKSTWRGRARARLSKFDQVWPNIRESRNGNGRGRYENYDKVQKLRF
jgi:hypothetical protein